MANERLRAALAEHNLTYLALADELGVNVKTVERWVAHDYIPFPRNRHRLATRLGRDESYLFPTAVTGERAAAVSESEIVRVYPQLSDVSADAWRTFFESGGNDIGILVYAGLFVAESTQLQRIIRKKANAGSRVRILLGDPDDSHVAERGREQGIGEALAAKVRNSMVLFSNLAGVPGIEFRTHRTILYNSIFRADDALLVNTHIYGLPATQAPVWHLRKIPAGQLASHYLESFERVWESAQPIAQPG
ncbi:helix-turn-helix transcriptional regulator [Kribbella sp. NPDC026611]|uniref:helix-turn-helix transcriptional regulator n=1 Tax=Kribbella sp. NPDC026611 TaxID=3154911 RepID=UPI0033D4B6DF